MNSTPLNCCNCLLSGWWQASRILCPAHRLAGELWWAPRRFDVFHVTMWYAENQVQAKSENHEEAVKLAGSSAGYCMAFWKNTTPCPSIFRSKNPWSWRESWVILENRLVNNGDCWPFSGVMHIFSIFFATCDLYNFGKFRDESCWSSMEPWEVVGEKLKAITVCQIILDAFFWLYWDTLKIMISCVSNKHFVHGFCVFCPWSIPNFVAQRCCKAKCLAQLCRMHLLAREYGIPWEKMGANPRGFPRLESK